MPERSRSDPGSKSDVHYYSLSGVRLASVERLGLVPSSDTGLADVTFRLSREREIDRIDRWRHHFRSPESGEPWLSVARCGDEFLLRFPDLADFIVSAHGDAVRCRAAPGVPAVTIEHFLIDQVLPLVLCLRGETVLHASTVATPIGAVAFLGEAGWGKSTLAASFCQDGSRLLTDDCLVLEDGERGLLAIPGYPGVRLWPDSVAGLAAETESLADVAHYSDKLRMGFDGDSLPFSSRRQRLAAICLLATPDEMWAATSIRMRRLAERDAMMALVHHAYRLDPTDKTSMAEEFRRMAALAARVRMYRLSFPRRYSELPGVRESILEKVSATSVAVPESVESLKIGGSPVCTT